MSRLRAVVGAVVTALWVTGYLGAFFVDRTLEPLAQSITPVMLVVVGFLFASEGLDLLRGKVQATEEPRNLES